MRTGVNLALILIVTALAVGSIFLLEESDKSSAEITTIHDFEELKNALGSDVPDIEIVGKITIEENIEIHEGTTVRIPTGSELFLPFENGSERDYALGSSKHTLTNQSASEDYCFVSLTNNGKIICDGKSPFLL